MATILCIDTSTSVCSTALTSDGMVLLHREDFSGRNHAALLSGFIKDCLEYLRDRQMQLSAVAVTLGPGSYTGLRIGLSEAKGLAYAMELPLIGISSLKLLAVHGMWNFLEADASTVFVPMIDARRMEVFTGAYDMYLHEQMQACAMILERGCLDSLKSIGRIVLLGDGSDKAIELFADAEISHLRDAHPLASDMLALAEKAYLEKDFIDLAYSTPQYLKDFQGVKPRNPLSKSLS